MKEHKKKHNVNHRFQDQELSKQSKEHQSIRNQGQSEEYPCFGRMEFLSDGSHEGKSIHRNMFFYHARGKRSEINRLSFQASIQNAIIIAGKKGIILLVFLVTRYCSKARINQIILLIRTNKIKTFTNIMSENGRW